MSLLTKTTKGIYGLAKRVPALLTASGVGWIGYSVFRDREYAPLPSPFPAEPGYRSTIESGTIATHETKLRESSHSGAPVLLVHGVNAAASSYEMAPLFFRMERERFTVAMDLPGFGHSDRAEREYTPEVMADGIAAVLDSLEEPAHVVALSLGSEFAARAASIRPDRVKSLTLISPTGMGSGSRIDPYHESGFDRLIENPLIGQALFDLLVTSPSIKYFLAKSFSSTVDPGLAAFAHLSGNQEGARYAPIAFLTGRLFTADALTSLYQPLMVPTLVLYDEDAYTDFANLPEFIADGRGTRFAERIAGTRGLPQFERPAETVDAINRFWKDIDSR